MNYNVSSIPLFDKQAKRLAKKYPSLKKELAILIEKLSENPEFGKALGNNFYKIRLAVASPQRKGQIWWCKNYHLLKSCAKECVPFFHLRQVRKKHYLR